MPESNETTPPRPKPSRWRRKGFWAFVLLNVAGLFLIIPLLMAVMPLAKIWWNTRSQESYRRYQEKNTASSALPANSQRTPVGSAPGAPVENQPLTELTNSLELIGELSESDLAAIMERQFGPRKPGGNPAEFDPDTAVFDSIKRGRAIIDGREFFGYQIDLVDEHGNHKVQIDFFTEPNLDYERSIEVLKLVQANPQLQKIYTAFAKNLPPQEADEAQSGSEAAGEDDEDRPAFRLELSPPAPAPSP
jgi:hypothetical protein